MGIGKVGEKWGGGLDRWRKCAWVGEKCKNAGENKYNHTLLEYALKCHFSESSEKFDTSLKCRELSESSDTSLKSEKNTFCQFLKCQSLSWSVRRIYFSWNVEKCQKNLTLLWRVRKIWSVACLKCQKNLSIFKSLLWSVTSLKCHFFEVSFLWCVKRSRKFLLKPRALTLSIIGGLFWKPQ